MGVKGVNDDHTFIHNKKSKESKIFADLKKFSFYDDNVSDSKGWKNKILRPIEITVSLTKKAFLQTIIQ